MKILCISSIVGISSRVCIVLALIGSAFLHDFVHGQFVFVVAGYQNRAAAAIRELRAANQRIVQIARVAILHLQIEL